MGIMRELTNQSLCYMSYKKPSYMINHYNYNQMNLFTHDYFSLICKTNLFQNCISVQNELYIYLGTGYVAFDLGH